MSGELPISFVRSEILPQRAPPSHETGLVRRLREGLFNNWINAGLTLLSLAFSVWVALSISPWLFNSVWTAKSLAECRQILGSDGGACWAVIRDRWQQLLFGFYPPEQYWRPVLAFTLMPIVLAPILFPSAPRKLLWLSFFYPGIAYWLIWGGTLWLVIAVYVGFALAFVLSRLISRVETSIANAAAFFATWLWWIFACGPAASMIEQVIPVSLAAVPSRELGGFLLSIVIGVTGISLSLPFGIALALGRRSRMPLIKIVSVIFIEFIRGVPLITLLFTASLLLNYFLPPGTTFDLILRVIIMVTLFATAYMAEVIRGGLAALPQGQYEAAAALGLGFWQAQRLVIMPQALKISIPGIVNSFIGLFKDTTLVVFIGLLDPIALTNAARANTAWQGIYWELFIFVGALFFVCCFGMSRYSMHLEQRLNRELR